MVIAQLSGGLGDQFYMYAAGRALANKLGTELKLVAAMPVDSAEYERLKSRWHALYRLGAFNITESFATPEEIKRVEENGTVVSVISTLSDFQNLNGDFLLKIGCGVRTQKYFDFIADILRKEFTLKKGFSPKAEQWKEQILNAECSVSMHFRHGDFLYVPNLVLDGKRPHFYILPVDYYRICLDILKQRNINLKVFVFSDNLPWVKENLRLDVPTYFVEGCATDDEEFILMSLCNHNIIPSSTFSECASMLNANPDKKIFQPYIVSAEKYNLFVQSLETRKASLLDSGERVRVPFCVDNIPDVTQRPYFSLLLVVNNDAATIAATLDSLLNQDYKYYEVIIIDNASTDGSRDICRQKIEGRKNVTFRRLYHKVKNAKAWNIALDKAEGYYVIFLKGNDRFLLETLTKLYPSVNSRSVDSLHSFIFLQEKEDGSITIGNKKFTEYRDVRFQKATRSSPSRNYLDGVKLLFERQINSFLGTKFFYRAFLMQNRIRFDKALEDVDAELFFQTEAIFKSKCLLYCSSAFYITPSNLNNPGGGGYLSSFLNTHHASIAIFASEKLNLCVA